MQEILITFLLFGLAVLLASTRFKPGSPRPGSRSSRVTDDRATTKPQAVVADAGQSSTENTQDPSQESNAAQPIKILTPLLVDLEPEVSLPLAASLPLQEAIHPETIEPTDHKLETNTSTVIEALADNDTQKEKDRDHQNVLEEIAQLGEVNHETTIVSLTRHANHTNPIVRATAAMTLGELVAKNQGHVQKEMVALLNQLLQDSNSEVQLQAAAALGKMQPPVNLA